MSSTDQPDVPVEKPSGAKSAERKESKYLHKQENIPSVDTVTQAVDEWANAWGERVWDEKRAGVGNAREELYAAERNAEDMLKAALSAQKCSDVTFMDGFMNFKREDLEEGGYIQLST